MSAADSFAREIAALVAAELRETLTSNGGAAGVRPRLMTLDQAAEYCARSRKAMEHLVASKAIPKVQWDRKIFIDVADLDRLIEASKE